MKNVLPPLEVRTLPVTKDAPYIDDSILGEFVENVLDLAGWAMETRITSSL